MLENEMSAEQISQAKRIMKNNLANHTDWIVLNATMDTLGKWSKLAEDLKTWLKPYLEKLNADERKSVSGKASKILRQLENKL